MWRAVGLLSAYLGPLVGTGKIEAGQNFVLCLWV